MADPFTAVYRGLWQLLEAHPGFASAVRPGNRLKLVDGEPHAKDQVSTADLPEVRIVPSGASSHLRRTSTTSGVTKAWTIQVATGDKRLDERLYPLEWIILCAMQRWPEVLGALVWADRKYVAAVQVLEHAEGQTDRDLVRGIDGWTAVMTVRVEMTFLTADMLAWQAGE